MLVPLCIVVPHMKSTDPNTPYPNPSDPNPLVPKPSDPNTPDTNTPTPSPPTLTYRPHPPPPDHLPQPPAHLPQTAYPFTLVLIFLGAYFPKCPYFPPIRSCPNAHRSQSAHFLKCSFVPVPTCPFVPNTSHFPKVPICTKCPRVHDDLTRRRFDARTI